MGDRGCCEVDRAADLRDRERRGDEAPSLVFTGALAYYVHRHRKPLVSQRDSGTMRAVRATIRRLLKPPVPTSNRSAIHTEQWHLETSRVVNDAIAVYFLGTELARDFCPAVIYRASN